MHRAYVSTCTTLSIVCKLVMVNYMYGESTSSTIDKNIDTVLILVVDSRIVAAKLFEVLCSDTLQF